MTTDRNDPTPPFADRVFADVLGAFELFSIHVGDRLGW